MKRIPYIIAVLLFCITMGSLVSAQSNEINNLDINGADIRDIFRSLGEMGNYNVLLDKTVQGAVVFKITNPMSIKQAIEMLAQTYGYGFRWIANGNTVIVGDVKTFEGFENRVTRVYKLNYGSVEQVSDALKVIIAKERIGLDVRANQITVHANMLEHENIEEVIKQLDREVPQVNIEARVEEIYNNHARDLGFNPSLDGYYHKGITSSGNSTITTVLSSEFDLIGQLMFMESENKAKLIANPNITTADNQEGRIQIGERIPFITKEYKDNEIIYKITYIDIGTILTITPRVNSDDVVTVTIKAEVSSQNGSVQFGENTVPKIDIREARAVVRLKQGETFVLSGLRQTEESELTTGLPYLSKIPILGWLFKSKKKEAPNNKHRELCIFITPKIIRTDKIVETKKIEPTKENDVKEEPVKPVETVKTTEQAPPPPAEPIQVVIDDEQTKPAVQRETSNENTTTPEVERTTAPADNTLEAKYTVKKGETVFAIARKFGVDAKTVLTRNNLSKESVVSSGQTLIIPIPADHLYELKAKETLWRLAKRYGTTVELLMEINSITDVSQVKVGTMIVLPTSVSKIVNPQF